MRSLKGNTDRNKLPNLLKSTNNIEPPKIYHTNNLENDFIFDETDEQMFDDNFREFNNDEQYVLYSFFAFYIQTGFNLYLI